MPPQKQRHRQTPNKFDKCPVDYLSVGTLCDLLEVILCSSGDAAEEDLL